MTASDLRSQDAEARSLSQREFDRPIVLEAGAGTGKTATLVARIVAWALGPGWERARLRAPEADARQWAEDCLGRVVAITFTDAAAAEMAERVGQALSDIEQEIPVIGFDAELLPPDAVERSRHLIAALDHLVVRTIHAWCRRILAGRPLAAGLHPAFEVDAEGEARRLAIRAELESVLAEERDGPTAADLARLVATEGVERIHDALDRLIEEGIRADDLRADPFAPDRVAAALADLETALAAFWEAGISELADQRGALVAIHDATRASLESVREAAPDGVEGVATWIGSLSDRWLGTAFNKLERWAREDFGATEQKIGSAFDLEAVARAALALRGRLRSLFKVDVEAHERARRVLAPLLEAIEGRLERDGQTTFAELLRRTSDLLQRSPAFCAALRREIELLLVDEFQDTDPLQCSIVGNLALAGDAGERPSLFVVGDPKQSIYGWRSADLAAYDGFVSRMCEGEGGLHLRLSVNFRSVPAILDEVERVIGPVMRCQPGLQPEFQKLLPCDAKASEAGAVGDDRAAVEHWATARIDPRTGELAAKTSAGQSVEIESRALAADLARQHRDGTAWKDMAVLFRTRSDMEVYLAAMREIGVPYSVERDRTWFERREVVDAAASFRCVVDPQDHLALLTWLRSPAVGVPDAALIPLWTRGLPAVLTELEGVDPERLEAIASNVRAAADATPRDVPGLAELGDWAENLIHAVHGLAQLRASFASEPADRFVERLRRTGLAELSEASRYAGAWRVANLDRFFEELADDLSRGGDVHEVLRRLRTGISERREAEAGRAGDPSIDAVRLMTIHKSKGLDFEHVYLVQLHKRKGGERGSPAVRSENGGPHVELELFGAPSLGFAEAGARRATVAATEAVRELYVALTRAESRLVLVGQPGAGAKSVDLSRSLADLVASREGESRSVAQLAAAAAKGQSTGQRTEGGVLWRLASSIARAEADRRSPGAELPSPDDVAAESRALRARSEAAARRMARSRSGRATPVVEEEHTPAEVRAERAERWSDPGAKASHGAQPPDAARRAAMAVGTAIHAVLEEWDPQADRAAELERQRERLAGRLAAEGRGEAIDAARSVLDAFVAQPLFERWLELAPHVVARELPVLRPPGSDETGPVGFESGVIDLVYRDPDSDELVVADYKTDRVAGREECEARATHYEAQGRFYTETLQRALGLRRAPRFELWFLQAGEIVG